MLRKKPGTKNPRSLLREAERGGVAVYSEVMWVVVYLPKLMGILRDLFGQIPYTAQ